MSPSTETPGAISTAVRYCGAPTESGAPCRQIVGLDVVDGRCPHHSDDPERRSAFRDAQSEGGRISALTRQLERERGRQAAPAEALAEVEAALGPLETAEQVRRALAIVAKWAAAGKIPSAAASATAKALDVAIRALAVEDDRRIITRLERRVQELERELALERRRPRAVR